MFKFRHVIVLSLIFLNILIIYKAEVFELISGEVVFPDFDNYYLLSNEIKKGINPYTVSHMITPAPPIVFTYFLPFSYLDIRTARILNLTVNLVSGYLLCYLLTKKYFRKYVVLGTLILSAIFYSSFPTRFSITLGQPLIFATLHVTLVLILKNSNLKAFVLSLLISIKAFLLITIFSYLRENKKLVVFIFVFLIIQVLVISIFVKFEILSYYFKNTFMEYGLSTQLPAGTDYYNQSLKSTLNRLYLGEFYLPIFLLGAAYAMFILIRTQSFPLSILLGILLSPVSWQQNYTLLFPIFLIALKKIKVSVGTIIFLSMSLFLWWSEFPFLHYAELNFGTRLLASHYFLSAVLLFFLLGSDQSRS